MAEIDKKTTLARKDGHYELPDINDKIECPGCDTGIINLKRTIYRLPDGEDVIIMNMECPKCGFKKNDLVSLQTSFKPGEYHLTVDDGDFTHKIFRGSSGDIEIPEIGIIIERGPAASYMMTNIEGILLAMQEQVQYFLRVHPSDTIEYENAQETLKKIENAMNNQMPFTLILRDDIGGSYVSPSKKEKMTFIPYLDENK